MAFITQQYVAVTGDTLTAAIWNTEFQNIITTFNGGITNANIQAAAGIEYSKLDLNGAILNDDLAGSIAKEKITNTAVTETDTQTLTNKTLTKPIVNASVHPIEVVSYTDPLDFDMDVSNHFFAELTGSPAVTFSNADSGQCWIIHLRQDGTGSRTVSWPSIKWAGGSAPTLTTTGLKVDTLGFIQNGADVYGYVIGKNI
jgi:hypothetical protein